LRSLLGQTHPAQEIRLYIPVRYRRFPEWDGELPDVPEGVTIVRTAADLGPATKVLPAVKEFKGQSIELLLCDDDRIYDPGWARRFALAREEHPDCLITEDGANVPDHEERLAPQAIRRRKDWNYRLVRAASLGLYKPPRWCGSGYLDLFKGYSGALLRPDFVPDFAFDIPELLWTVDDVWLSGCLVTNGVAIWLNADCPISKERHVARRDALLAFSHLGNDRRQANRNCWNWFKDNKAIWQSGNARSAPAKPDICYPSVHLLHASGAASPDLHVACLSETVNRARNL
jgi:hypothetical protein